MSSFYNNFGPGYQNNFGQNTENNLYNQINSPDKKFEIFPPLDEDSSQDDQS